MSSLAAYGDHLAAFKGPATQHCIHAQQLYGKSVHICVAIM